MKITIPKVVDPITGQRIPFPDIRQILATPDPGLWEGVRKHAAEAGVTIVVEGEGILADKLRDKLTEGSKPCRNVTPS